MFCSCKLEIKVSYAGEGYVKNGSLGFIFLYMR